ncbi:bifunctional 4-hydroxy-2-oxoglutarate aldolase/2-dehydro-3-deoxy-phosphogluconate aldolase [Actinomadura violacea]|uniref:Bifunctional 4-hydroxy-2-oxoglutarate aldolase/2-dehydro-3-deoxy-phosphogluconate aldolase n=1 Tax=Actinomadura violacea TaxID=2819934 RepID=A0ABS3S9V2_9ACTN|nr:bifunctional 4-hydroxy-2-oxoglutarate aldolase/2-dehydro-3-deoxy-phosphogluconate aldolase [Actinomadura violacea]MBO2465338.1 bifunctional 4-hydroxy-2-oxoglutarate aldolase/2-dehydro-3-deoxy-phosphogluconate aldolase [Actinomadura violacea]
MVRTTIAEELERRRLVAIVRGPDPAAAARTALTLAEEGVTLIEVSLSGAGALDVIEEVAGKTAGAARIGAGTVLTADDTRRARDAGAEYAVTPALGAGVDEALRLGLPVLAGALTPTEVAAAVAAGATAVKLFPASAQGPGYLSALRDPFPDVPFVPVGGVGEAEAAEYLRRGAVAVGVGSPLCGDAPRGGDLAGLRRRARAFLAVTAAPGGPA